MAKRRAKNFIGKAIKRPGALTSAVGGPPGENIGKVRKLSKTGTPQQKRQANFFLNVLRKESRVGRKK